MLVLAEESFLFALFVCIGQRQDFSTQFAHQLMLNQPRSHFGNQSRIFGIGHEDVGSFLHLHERVKQSQEVICRISTLVQVFVQETFGHRLQSHRFFPTVAMSVSTEIGVVGGKDFQFFGCTRENFLHGIAPSLHAIIFIRVPGIGCHTINGEQG